MEVATKFALGQVCRISEPKEGEYRPYSIRNKTGHRFQVREIVIQDHRGPQVYYTIGRGHTKRLVREEYVESAT